MAAAVGLHIIKWFLVSAFGTAGWVLILLIPTGGGAYLVYRGCNPQRAHGLEAQFQNAARTAMQQMTTPRPAAPVAPVTPVAPPAPGMPTAPQAYGHPGYPTPTYPAAAARPATGTSALPSILMLVPSLLAYVAVEQPTNGATQVRITAACDTRDLQSLFDMLEQNGAFRDLKLD